MHTREEVEKKINAILLQNTALEDAIGKPVRELQERFLLDKNREYISEERHTQLTNDLLRLVQATENLDYANVKNIHREMTNHCQYQRKTVSKVAALGMAIGLLIEGVSLALIMGVSLGVGAALVIPAWAIALDMTTAGAMGGAIGALFGHSIYEYKAKYATSNLVSNSMFKFISTHHKHSVDEAPAQILRR